MNKVFLISQIKHHEANLKDFGEVIEVFPNNFRRPSQFNPSEYGAALLDRLHELGYKPSRDFIAVTGSVNGLFIAAASLGMLYPKFKFLMFDARDSSFHEHNIEQSVVVP